MPGMGGAPQNGNSVVVSAFHNELFHQLLLVLVIGAVCAIAFNVIRTVQYRQLRALGGHTPVAAPAATPEAVARRVLRIGFGGLWILDGLLQLQSAMPLGLPSSVVQPAAAGSPQWVQHVVTAGANIWSNHPIQAASSAVWIQLGLGLWLILAPRGRWSRLGGAATVGWGLVVWIFGEAFGGIFAPGATWLFGTPGAVLIYCVGGLLVALPERAFLTPRLGRIVLTLGGVFLIGMSVLQAWPGRGFWQGRGGTLQSMVAQMAQTSQPGFLPVVGGVVRLLRPGPRVGRQSVRRGGPGRHRWPARQRSSPSRPRGDRRTRRAVPRRLGAGGGLRLLRRLSAPTRTPWCPRRCSSSPVTWLPSRCRSAVDGPGCRGRRGRAGRRKPSPPFPVGPSGSDWSRRVTPAYLLRSFAALAALAVVVVGAAPMAAAAINQSTDPILTQAVNGTPNSLDLPAPPFTLTDQHGQSVSLASLRGHTVALTFLDPVCTTDCPLIAQEFRQTDQQLGGQAARVDFVAVVANPIYRTAAFTNAFDRQEGLTRVPNWYFLTGSLPALERVWDSYGVLVSVGDRRGHGGAQ